ncbi:MAG: glycosyltransferase family 2 protein [Thiobacillus sp.]|nr:glycosyltransferase family 2 protein [Thiobacillus sp.]
MSASPAGLAGQGVAIVLLNYNGWRDTLTCIDSLFAMNTPFDQLLVCDNGSTDASLEQLRQGLNQRLPRYAEAWCGWGRTVDLSLAETDRVAIEAGSSCQAPIVLVDNQGNLGFAAGNNVGLRLAQRNNRIGYFWLLNNDTEVRTDALDALCEAAKQRPEVGLWGCTVVYHDRPDVVQALGGGGVNRYTAETHHLRAFLPLTEVRSDAAFVAEVEAEMAYVLGASMFATRAWLDRVGLLSERYFLYYEELDWAEQARGLLPLGFAPSCVILHKEGASIGTDPSGGSALSLKHLNRSRLLFAHRFLPGYYMPLVLVNAIKQPIKLMLKGRFKHAYAAFQGILLGLSGSNSSV